jgi:hypothetical protein
LSTKSQDFKGPPLPMLLCDFTSFRWGRETPPPQPNGKPLFRRVLEINSDMLSSYDMPPGRVTIKFFLITQLGISPFPYLYHKE